MTKQCQKDFGVRHNYIKRYFVVYIIHHFQSFIRSQELYIQRYNYNFIVVHKMRKDLLQSSYAIYFI